MDLVDGGEDGTASERVRRQHGGRRCDVLDCNHW